MPNFCKIEIDKNDVGIYTASLLQSQQAECYCWWSCGDGGSGVVIIRYKFQ